MTSEWESAVHRGSIEELEALLSSGADIDARDKHGQTALMLASRKGHGRVVEWLVEHGARLDVTAKYGLSALMLAVVNGHRAIVKTLAMAGADLLLRGTGAPGFHEKTALDLALARDDREMVDVLRSQTARAATPAANPHFETASSWASTRTLLSFEPLEPSQTEGYELQALRIHVRDHKKRQLRLEDRTLEAHYGGFVLSQAWKGTTEARRLALAVPYGLDPREASVFGREARVYELGPEVAADDLDGRNPSVVTWCDGEMFYLLASTKMPSEALLRIAASLYRP